MIKIDENLTVTSPVGFKASGIHCGLKKSLLKKDLALIYSDVVATSCGVYTKNKVKGAPLTITKQHLINKKAQAIIINSGNANTCNGDDGLSKAKKMTHLCAKALSIKNDDVLVASTGVIGVPLNIDAIKNGIPQLVGNLSSDIEGAKNASMAIMTTDTYPKKVAVTIEVGGKEVTIGGMAKGSGMINPNMATMLCFITTDCAIAKPMLDKALKDAVADSFNMICVDGDMSTNDTVLALANGMAENTVIDSENEDYAKFAEALMFITKRLAISCADDGEGATKLMEANVKGAKNVEDARKIALSVVSSTLLKAALFGEDANWGRALCAMGYSGADFDPMAVTIDFRSDAGTINLMNEGVPIVFDEEKASKILAEHKIYIDMKLKEGNGEATAWGCDLTYDYVKINGDYRS